jgi:hypothetical protein
MSFLSGIAGAVRGGSEALGDVAEQHVKTDLQAKLNQQLADLKVQEEQKIADYTLTQRHGEQARVAGILSGAGSDPESQQAALNAAGLIGEGTELGKQNEYTVTPGGAWGTEGVLNRNTGKFTPVADPGQTHLNAQAARGGASAMTAAQWLDARKGLSEAVKEAVPAGAKDPVTGEADTTAQQAAFALLNTRLAQDPSAWNDGSRLNSHIDAATRTVNDYMTRSNAAATAAYPKGPADPQWRQARDLAFNHNVSRALATFRGQSSAPAGSPAPASTSTPAPTRTSAPQAPPAPTPGLLAGAAPAGPLSNLTPGAAAGGAGAGLRFLQRVVTPAAPDQQDNTPTGVGP